METPENFNPFAPVEEPTTTVISTINILTPEKVNEIQDQIKLGASLVIVPPGSKGLIIRKHISPELTKEVADITNALQSIKGITSQESAANANKVLKRAKSLSKELENDRKRMDGPLNDEKSDNKALEDSIIGALNKLISIVNTNITQFQIEEEERARKIAADLQAKKDQELADAQKERDRVAKIKDLILSLERNCLNAMQQATIADIDDKIAIMNAVKLQSEVYMEFYNEALELLATLRSQFQTRKAELLRLAELEKENAEQAALLKQQQEKEAAEAQEKLKEKQQADAQKQLDQQLNDTANIQMGHELKESMNLGAKGVQKRWAFDEETIDMSLLPAEYHTYDKAKITKAISEGLHEIPGVNIYQKIINVSR